MRPKASRGLRGLRPLPVASQAGNPTVFFRVTEVVICAVQSPCPLLIKVSTAMPAPEFVSFQESPDILGRDCGLLVTRPVLSRVPHNLVPNVCFQVQENRADTLNEIDFIEVPRSCDGHVQFFTSDERGAHTMDI